MPASNCIVTMPLPGIVLDPYNTFWVPMEHQDNTIPLIDGVANVSRKLMTQAQF